MAEQTPKITRNIPYRYVCEHCGTTSEWKTAHVTGETEQAIDSTVIPAAQKKANKGNFFELNNINGKCPCCGKHQSWELGEAKAWMIQSPLMGLGLGCMVGGVGAFLTVFFFGLLGAFILFMALAIVGMIGAFLYGLIRYIVVKKDAVKARVRFMPEVVWNTAPTAPALYAEPVAPVQFAEPASSVQFAAPTAPALYAAPTHQALPLATPQKRFDPQTGQALF